MLQSITLEDVLNNTSINNISIEDYELEDCEDHIIEQLETIEIKLENYMNSDINVDDFMEKFNLILSTESNINLDNIPIEFFNIAMEKAGANYINDTFNDMRYSIDLLIGFLNKNRMDLLNKYFEENSVHLKNVWDPNKVIKIRDYKFTLEEMSKNFNTFLNSLKKFTSNTSVELNKKFMDPIRDIKNVINSGNKKDKITKEIILQGVKQSLANIDTTIDFGSLIGKSGDQNYTFNRSKRKVTPSNILNMVIPELYNNIRVNKILNEFCKSPDTMIKFAAEITKELQELTITIKRSYEPFGRSNADQIYSRIAAGLSSVTYGATLAAYSIISILSRFTANQMHAVVTTAKLMYMLTKKVRKDIKYVYRQLGL